MNAIVVYRLARWLHLKGVPVLPTVLQHLIFLIYNSYIPFTAEIGEGTRFGYGAMGVVIHSRCRIGKRCIIGQQVTLGGRSHVYDVPVLGDDVYVGAGAKILGGVSVGSCSVIGANAVVLHDVPPQRRGRRRPGKNY